MKDRSFFTKPCMIIEILSYVIYAICFVVGIGVVMTTEGPIPTHYGFHFQADGYGPPATVFIVPGILLVTNIIMSLSLHVIKPESWNLPFKVNPGKEAIVYHDTSMMIVVMMVSLAVYTLASTLLWGKENGGTYVVLSILLCAVLFFETIFFILRAAFHNKD